MGGGSTLLPVGTLAPALLAAAITETHELLRRRDLSPEERAQAQDALVFLDAEWQRQQTVKLSGFDSILKGVYLPEVKRQLEQSTVLLKLLEKGGR